MEGFVLEIVLAWTVLGPWLLTLAFLSFPMYLCMYVCICVFFFWLECLYMCIWLCELLCFSPMEKKMLTCSLSEDILRDSISETISLESWNISHDWKFVLLRWNELLGKLTFSDISELWCNSIVTCPNWLLLRF